MLRKQIRKYLPDASHIRGRPILRFLGTWLVLPHLWHLNRRAVAGGVAVGGFAGMLPGPVQFLFASILAMVFKVNLPVAVVTTLYTNPITFVPIVYAAYKLGSLLLGIRTKVPVINEFHVTDWRQAVPELTTWLLSRGWVYLIGALALGLVLEAIGYWTVILAWRLHVLLYLRKRSRRNGDYGHWPGDKHVPSSNG